MINPYGTADIAWYNQLEFVAKRGELTSPRRMKTLEILGDTVGISMRYPVVTNPMRKLSYHFMASEALWIISGSRNLNFNKHIREKLERFSDDGETLSGAYGVPFVNQIKWVVDKLSEDPDSRQAVMTIWNRNPPQSKDIPCTIALQFLIREDMLHTNAFMRSSDVWLGLPYDLFSFSIMSMVIALQSQVKNIGNLTVSMGSSHLYEENFSNANQLLVKGKPYISTSPWELNKIKSIDRLMDMLLKVSKQEKNSKAGELLFAAGGYK
jgi:thymidylate synthase